MIYILNFNDFYIHFDVKVECMCASRREIFGIKMICHYISMSKSCGLLFLMFRLYNIVKMLAYTFLFLELFLAYLWMFYSHHFKRFINTRKNSSG